MIATILSEDSVRRVIDKPSIVEDSVYTFTEAISSNAGKRG
jgi:hypothetical protein